MAPKKVNAKLVLSCVIIIPGTNLITRSKQSTESEYVVQFILSSYGMTPVCAQRSTFSISPTVSNREWFGLPYRSAFT